VSDRGRGELDDRRSIAEAPALPSKAIDHDALGALDVDVSVGPPRTGMMPS